MDAKKQKQQVEQYKLIRNTYLKFSECVKNILTHALPDNFKVHSIENRAKSEESFENKCLKLNDDESDYKYLDPLNEITDLAGIRVIAFFPKSVPQICSVIEENFKTLWKKDIGEERFNQGKIGYKSIHFLVQLPEERVRLAEYKAFKGLTAEIQVRTILQHAWAEMEHDIQYKSSEQIPLSIQKRFIALAGVLEIADREFQAVQDEDEKIRSLIKASLEDELTRPIDGNKSESSKKKTGDIGYDKIGGQFSTKKVREMMMSGDYAKAVTFYSKLIQDEPDSYTLYIGRAKANFLAGHRSQAIEDLQIASQLNPEDPSIQNLRSKIEDGILVVQANNQAWQLTSKANEKLAEGNGEEAFQLYSEAQSFGFSAFYSTFNKAMACALTKDHNGASYFLGQITPTLNSAIEVNVLALNSIISAISGHGFKNNFNLLKNKLEMLEGYQKNQSPLRYLESGFYKRDTIPKEEIVKVFDFLTNYAE